MKLSKAKCKYVVDRIEELMKKEGIKSLDEIRGIL